MLMRAYQWRWKCSGKVALSSSHLIIGACRLGATVVMQSDAQNHVVLVLQLDRWRVWLMWG